MKINVKARLQNKAFVISLVTLVISFVYKILAAFEIMPAVSEYEVLSLFDMAVNVLALMGVFIDPTTEGVSDSDRAMTYCTCYDVRKIEEVIAVE